MDDRLLAGRASTGDLDSFGQLYDRYADKVYRHVYYRVGNPAEAEDIAPVFAFLASPARESVIAGVSKLEPGHLLTTGPGRSIRTERSSSPTCPTPSRST